MDLFKITLKPAIVRKETSMIINENNKSQILKGTVKRGFNQDPNEIREKLYISSNPIIEKKEPIVSPKNIQKNVREAYNQLRKLK